jgi:nucleotide-binding universal stress UspA family protein
MFQRILCAVDRNDASAKVMRHAAGLAAATGARLFVVHVGSGRDPAALERALSERFMEAVPYSAGYVGDPNVRIVTGVRADAILAEAVRSSADLIVTGSRGHGALAGWLLGSTTRALLEATTIPVLMIAAVDVDIVTLTPERPHLHPGAIVAALDLTERNEPQLATASLMAGLGRCPLILLTVLAEGDRTTDHDAAETLRERGHNLAPVQPHAVIVRHGDVAQEIARCAQAEDAGLVIMGLYPHGRSRRAGAIANSVLALQRPAVLAVPDGWRSKTLERPR